jgi:hypothetical protein
MRSSILRSIVVAMLGKAGLGCTLAFTLASSAALGAPCAGFTDVDTSSSFCANVAWLKNRAITQGCTSTAYCPGDNVIRLQMAAFMTRLGDALTPVQLAVDAAPGAIDLDASSVVCETADFVATGFARVAYADVRFSGNASAAVDVAADLVMSTDGGANWNNLNLFSNRGFVPANRWGMLSDLGFASLEVAQSARFGVRITRGGMAGSTDLADSRCELRVRIHGRDVSAPPVVKVFATIPNASEVGPVPGQFTVSRSGGDLAAPLTVPFALSGTATNCADYACIPSVTIAAAQTSVQVPVTVLQDTLAEGTETVILALVPDESIVIGTPGAVVSIANGPAPINLPPMASAGSDQTITLPAVANLAGSATDDGNPNPPATLTIAWSKVSGPGPVSFGDAGMAATTASFGVAGSYVLRLTANDGALSAQDDVTITVNPPGGTVLLPGPPGAPANNHIPDIFIPDVTAAELTPDARPGGIGLLTSRTRILVRFSDAATVANANALLQSISATIIGTMQDIKVVIVNIPDIGDLTGLDNALAVLRGSAHVSLAVQDVALDVMVASVPSHLGAAVWGWNFPPSVNAGIDGNWGLEAVRAPQMWNLNTFAMRHDVLRSSPLPRTGVLDLGFNDVAPPGGDGTNDHPFSDLSGLQTWIVNGAAVPPVLQPGASFIPGVTGHGQHVAGIIGAVFNDGFGVDGINPLAETHAADGHLIGVSAAGGGGAGVLGGWMYSIFNRDLSEMMRNWPDLRVVNISLGYNWYLNAICPPPRVDANNNAAAQLTVVGHGTLSRLIFSRYPNTLFVAAAGNDSIATGMTTPIADCVAPPGNETPNAASREVHARWASPFNWAALHTALPVPAPSPNVIVVEAVQGTVADTTVPSYRWRYTKADYSNVGGIVSAPGGGLLPGTGILSTVGANMGAGHADYMSQSGTSQAAPHVTGLIGFLLHLDETLTAQELKSLVTGAAFTKTTMLAGNESSLPSGVSGPAPMIDAFAAMIGIDLLPGHPPLRIQRALADVDDGTPDGNTRVDPFTGSIDGTINRPDQRRGDGMVSIQDFRAWRDAYLQVQQADIAPLGLAVALDGGQLHFKKDLNFDGCVAGQAVSPSHPVDIGPPAAGCAGSPLQNVYPRYDLNGDGEIGPWFKTAPFKMDPDTVFPGENKTFIVRTAPDFLRDIDVMADPNLWAVTAENVETNPAAEGLPAPSNEWGPRRFLLGNRDTGIAAFQDIPDYLHSFDLHLQLDWSRINSNYEGVQIQVQSERVAPYAQTFDRQITVAHGQQPTVVTLPIWTGKVKVTFTPVDDVPPTVAPTDPGYLQTTTKELTGLQFGEDRALVHPRFPVVIDDIAPGRTNIGSDAAGTIYVAYERQVSSSSDGSEIRDHWFARSGDGGLTWSATQIASGEQRRRDALAIGGNNQVYIVHVLGNPSQPAPIGNASVQLIRSSNGGASFTPSVISTAGTTNVDFHTDVATDAAGKVYVVWAESGTNPAATEAKNPYMIRMRTSTNGGTSFSAPVTIHADPSPGAQWYPRGAQIAVTPDGQQIHVTWTQCVQTDVFGNCTSLSLRYSRSVNGAAFSAPVGIAQNQFLTSFYDLAVDPAGNVSVVYPTNGATTSTVNYVRVENGAVVRTVNASLTPPNFFAFAPRLAIDGSGAAWITWFEGSNTVFSEVYALRTSDGGVSFAGRQNISNSLPVPSGASSIGPDHNGAPLIVWGEQGTTHDLWFRPVLSP